MMEVPNAAETNGATPSLFLQHLRKISGICYLPKIRDAAMSFARLWRGAFGIQELMPPSSTFTFNLEAGAQEAETNNDISSLAKTMFSKFLIRENFNRAVCDTFGRIWNHIKRRAAFIFREEVALGIMPSSTPSFIIAGLFAFTQIKGQAPLGFPFHTHRKWFMVSITSLLLYGAVSVAELIIFAAGYNPTSVYAIIARLGRIASFCVLVVSLAALVYS